MKSISTENARQLELVRATVDEKLQRTLERRLGESFKQVSDRLELARFWRSGIYCELPGLPAP